jgi:hypothetical protein
MSLPLRLSCYLSLVFGFVFTALSALAVAFDATLQTDAGGNLALHWPSESGRYYRVESSSDLGGWRPVTSEIAGTGQELKAIARPAAVSALARQFWRVTASSPFVATFFVDGSAGDDAQPGTLDHPWRSLAKAAASLRAGEVVFLRAGTYRLATHVHPQNKGTKLQPITFANFPGESVLIDGGAGSCVSLQFSTGITFRGLRFTTTSTQVGASMIYLEATNDCAFIDCEFFGLPAPVGSENTSVLRCMGTENGYSSNVLVRNCYFHDNLAPALRLYDTDGWIIENNEFRRCEQAVGGKDSPTNMIVRRNLIADCGLAFYFAAQDGCRNVSITENLVLRTGGGFMIGGLGTYGHLREDVRLLNNTFVDCTNFILGWDDGFTTGQLYANNLFLDRTARNIGAGSDTAGRFLNLNKYGSVPVDSADYVMDYNCLSIPPTDGSIWFIDAALRASSLASWTALHPPFEQHSIITVPVFVDAANGDYHLKPGSPCLGRGRTGEDLGAYPRGNDGTIIGRLP